MYLSTDHVEKSPRVAIFKKPTEFSRWYMKNDIARWINKKCNKLISLHDNYNYFLKRVLVKLL